MKAQSKSITVPIMRFLGLLAAVVTVVSSVTYAALQSQYATLKGNIIQTAIASLQLSADGTAYTNSLMGYAYTSLVPGGQPMPNTGNPVYIKNTGTSQLQLKLNIGNQFTNTDNLDLSKVHLILDPFAGGASQNILFSDLVAPGGAALTQAAVIGPGQSTGYFMRISLDADAMSGSSATLSNVDFNFSGVSKW